MVLNKVNMVKNYLSFVFIIFCLFCFTFNCDFHNVSTIPYTIDFVGEWRYENTLIPGPIYRKEVYNFYEDSTYKYRYYEVEEDSIGIVFKDTGKFSINETLDTLCLLSFNTNFEHVYSFYTRGYGHQPNLPMIKLYIAKADGLKVYSWVHKN